MCHYWTFSYLFRHFLFSYTIFQKKTEVEIEINYEGVHCDGQRREERFCTFEKKNKCLLQNRSADLCNRKMQSPALILIRA